MNEVTLHTVVRDARICYEKGEAALIHGNRDYALDMFEAALHIEPRLLAARRMLRNAAETGRRPSGRLYRARTGARLMLLASTISKRPMEVLRITESILKTDPSNRRAALLQSHAAVAAGMEEVAMQTLELFLKEDPRAADAWTRLASLYRTAGFADKEYQCWKQLAELDAGNTEARKQLRQTAAQMAMNHNGWDRSYFR